MTWHNPEAFLLLVLLFYLYIYSSFLSTNKKGTFFYSGLDLFFKKTFTLRAAFIFLPKLLKFVALIFVILALARPQTAEDKTNQSQKGLDIMIVMDISLSMLAEDMGPGMTRLESSKNVVRDFIQGRSNDRIGLIAFSGESFTQVPLTFDHKLLKSSLTQIKPLSSIKAGTAIGVALANAALRLKHSPTDSRIIILLTDGENNAGFIDPETALQIVKKDKIKVYTIGLGSQRGNVPIKYKERDAKGRSFYQKVYIETRINKKLLKKISFQTGGEFFIAKNLISLKKVFKKIDTLETYDIQINKWTQYEEHFITFLAIGAILYFLSLFFSLTVFFRGI